MLTARPKRERDERRNDGATDQASDQIRSQIILRNLVADTSDYPALHEGASASAADIAPRDPAIRGELPAAGRQDRIATICDGVIDIAAALFNVSGRELRSPGRSPQPVSRVRQIAMYVTHVTLRLTMSDVGQGFGRDRTTVLYACHQIEDLREEEEFDDIVARVERVVMVAFGVLARQD